MRDCNGQILIQFRPQLVEDIEPAELLNQLLSRNVLTKRQTKSISCLVDPYKQNEAILDALHRRPDEDFDKFCDALTATNQHRVVCEYLKPSSYATETESTKSVNESVAVVDSLCVETRDGLSLGIPVMEEIGIKPRSGKEQIIEQESDAAASSATTASAASDVAPAADWQSAKGPTAIDEVVVRKSTLEFYQQYKDKSYPVTRQCRGKCLIICNAIFSGWERAGADVDLQNLKRLFTRLQFNVEVHGDLTAQRMKAAVKSAANDDGLNAGECFVMCVMSHGRQAPSPGPTTEAPVNVEVILGTDKQPVSTASLLAPFADEYCAALRGKPRIVIFQACRGDVVDKTETDSIPSASSSSESTAAAGNEDTELQLDRPLSLKDFIIGYPTQSGFRSFRNTSHGSWYINALTRVFAEHACDTDVAGMLRSVNRCVSQWVSNSPGSEVLNKGCQTASIVDNLTRDHLFLFPGQPT